MLRLELNCAQGTMTLHKNGVRAGQVASGVLPESGGALSWMIMVLNPLAVVRVINASPPPPVQPMASAAAPVAAVAVAAPTEPQVVMAQPVQQVRSHLKLSSGMRTQSLRLRAGGPDCGAEPAGQHFVLGERRWIADAARNQPRPRAAAGARCRPVAGHAARESTSTCVNHLQRLASGC